MADLRISELTSLAGVNLAGGDLLPIVDVSASETKKITVTDLGGYATTLIADASIPSAKILFGSGSIVAASLATDSVTTAKIQNDAVTAAKLADESTVDLVTTLPGSGAFVGQIALDTDDNNAYIWNGSSWVSFKAAGSVGSVVGSTAGTINIVVSTSGNEVTISATLDNTASAAQFLAGPAANAGAVSYRTITGADLPAPTTNARGGVAINGEGLRMDGAVLEIDNDVTANVTYGLVTYNAKGLVTNGRTIISGDLPAATSVAKGAVIPGTGLSVDGSGNLNHSNSATPGTYTKVTIDSQGHVSSATTLTDADIPNLPATKLTSGTLNAALVGTNSVTGTKLANESTVKFGGSGSTAGVVTFPTADYKGQLFWDELNGDMYIWSGSAWLPVTITAGELVFGGTYDASVNELDSVTSAGAAAGLTTGAGLPAASETNNRYYVVVSESGTGTAPAPAVALAPPDMLLSTGSTWELIDVSNAIAGQTAGNISFTPYGTIIATNVQAALQEVDDDKLAKAGGTVTGELLIGNTGSFAFEGSTDNTYETYLTVVDPTADRTITFPNASGTVLLAGNGQIVNADIDAAAAISFSKLASLTAGHLLVGNASNVATSTAISGDVTINSSGVTAIASGVIVDGDISATAEIAVSKLADGAARQLLQTDAAGTGVEWTDNVDIPGTLDVTGAATFDSTVTVASNVTLNAQADLRFADSDSSHWVAFQAPATVTSNVTWTLPATDGTSGQALGTNGTGTLSWSSYAGLDTAQTWTKGQRGEITALTDAATITPDFSDSNNFSVTLGGNRTLANPTNLVAGQSGCIWITQDGTGSRTLAYGSNWDFTGGTAPTLTTTASARDCLVYSVQSATQITATLITNLS